MYYTLAEKIGVTILSALPFLFIYLTFKGKWGDFFRLMGKLLAPVVIVIAGLIRFMGFIIALIIAAIRKESPPSFSKPSEPKKSPDYYHNDNSDKDDVSDESNNIYDSNNRRDKEDRDDRDKGNRKIDEYHI